MKSYFQPKPLALAITLFSPLIAAPHTAVAQSNYQAQALLTFDLPSDTLTRTINRIARQAGEAISWNSELTVGKQSKAIQGRYTLVEALELVLQGTELHLVRKSSGEYTLELRHNAVPEPAEALDNLMVIGTAEHGYTAPESVSAARSYIALADTPRSVQTLSQAFIVDANVDRLEDALMYIPGVERANDLGQLEHSVRIRGFSSDGMVFRDSKRKKYGGQINMNMIERIEVVKGPASVQFGANSPGGIVNVITKRPKAESHTILTAKLDEHGGRELLADITGASASDDKMLFRLIASTEDSDTYRDFSEIKSTTFSPAMRYLFSKDTLLDVVYQHQYSKRPINQGLYQDNFTSFDQIPKNMNHANFGEPDDAGEYDNHLFDIALQHRINQVFRADVSYVFSDQSLETQSTDAFDYQIEDSIVDGVYRAKGSVLRDRFGYTDYDTRSHQISALLHGDITLGETQHLFSLGMDYTTSENSGNWYFADTHDNSSGIDVFNVFDRRYGQYKGDKDTDTLEKRKNKELGLFITESAWLTDQLIVNLGLRYDDISVEGSDTYTDGSDRDIIDNKESDYSWNVGLLYKFNPDIALYASYATSFEPNYSAPDIGEHKNQRGKQWEVGLKGDINGELLYSLAYYDLTRNNVPKELPDETMRLVGEQQSKGFELDLSYDINERWMLMASYAYTDAEYKKDPENPELEGKNVAGIAPHMSALFTRYSLDDHIPGLSLIGGVKYRGKAPFNDANTFDTEAFTTVDAGVKYHMPLPGNSSLNLQAGVQNLTDKEGIWTDNWSINYSAPRTFYLNADYRF